MTPIEFLPAAIADLQDIFFHIAQDDVEAADRMVDRIHAGVARLLDFPFSGRTYPDLDDMRGVSITPYIAFYRVTEKGVRILRVLHGARDLDALFETDD